MVRGLALRILGILLSTVGFLFARQVPITILHTAELHGQLFPADASDDHPLQGGLLRAARYLEEVREEQRNVLLFDSGDSLGGAAESEGEPSLIVSAMNHLSYDAIAPGDQDLGRYVKRLAGLNAPILAANVQGLDVLRSHQVVQVDGVRVVVLGLTWPGFHHRYLSASIRVGPGVEALSGLMAEVKQLEPDVICLLAHQGAGAGPFGEIRDLIQRFPEIDVVIGGHTGQAVPETFYGETLFTQAGAGGLRVGRVDLVWDTVRRELIKQESRLQKLGSRFVASASLKKALEPALGEARAHLGQPIGELRGRFARRVSGRNSGEERLIGRALAEMTQAEIVWWEKDRVRLQEGLLTEQGLAAAVPEDEGLVRVHLTAADLREMITEALRVEPPLVWGMQWEVSAQGVYRVLDGMGKGMHARKRFSVVLPESLAASDGSRFPLLRRVVHQPVARLAPSSHSLRSALRAYVEKHTPIELRDE